MMQNNKKIEIYILTGFMGMWGIIALITIPKLYGPIILPDEFGYWAQAAGMAGMDWREVMTQYSWYSFGYGLLMLPFLKLIPDPVVSYRCMAGINFFLLGAATFLLYRVFTGIFGDKKKKWAALISGLALTYVAYISYAQTTMAEVLLTFLYVFLAYLLHRWFLHPGFKSGLLVFLTAMYMYMVHMRTVGILAATAGCMMTALFFQKEIKRKEKIQMIPAIFLSAVFILILTGVIKEGLLAGISSETYRKLTQTNDYAGQLGKIRYLCSWKGIYRFATGLAGKIFYMGCSSFGLYYWGMAFLLKKGKKLIISLLRKEECAGADWFCFWLLLSHAGAVLTANIFTLTTNRLDGVLYGRYHENTLPFILAFGIAEIVSRPMIKKRMLWFIGVTNISFFLVYTLLGNNTIMYMNRHSVLGILYAVALADSYDAKIMLYACLGGGLGSAAAILLARLSGGGKRKWGFILGIGMMQLLLAFFSWRYYIFPAHAGQEADTAMLQEMRERIKAGEAAGVTCVYSEQSNAPCLVQYMLRDVSLRMISEEEWQGADERMFIVVRSEEEATEEFAIQYSEVLQSPRYVIYCRQGEEMNNAPYP